MKIRRRSVYGTLERPVWELTIVGKGRRERAVPVSAATLAALHAHWADRDKDFEGAKVGGAGALAGPLLGPVIIPWTEASRRHIGGKAATAAGTKRILAFQPRWVDRVTPPTV